MESGENDIPLPESLRDIQFLISQVGDVYVGNIKVSFSEGVKIFNILIKWCGDQEDANHVVELVKYAKKGCRTITKKW